MAETLQELGDYIAGKLGASVGDAVKRLKSLTADKKLGRPVPPGFTETYRSRQDAALSEGVEPVPGVIEVVDAVEAARLGEIEIVGEDLGAVLR